MNIRKRLQLFKMLRKHRSLASKRSLNASQNKVAKYMIFIMSALMLLYLVGGAIGMSLIANESTSVTTIEFICIAFPPLLTVDFLMRFTTQQTPSQLIKPYVLLPIPRYACIDDFIGSSLLSSSNFIWFALFVPYLLMSVVFTYGIAISLGLLFFFWIGILINSTWYSIVRTLVNDTMRWWILPIAVYAIMYYPTFLEDKITDIFGIFTSIGTAIGNGSIMPHIVAIIILIILVAINRRLQYVHIWRELAHTETTKLRSISRFSFLDKYGEVGQYLQLEIKSIFRNKNPRKKFMFSMAIIIMFSLIISFTDIYDSSYMTNFWCLYNFVIYGGMQLSTIMCNEGNYIDCLMVRKENILSLFYAKYIFACAVVIFPFILMLPTVFSGKWSLLMLISYGVFTCGFQYFLLFQSAVYNKQTIPLNTKFIGKASMETNYFQLLISLSSFFVPVIFVSILQAFMSPTATYITMCSIGLVFILTSKMWMRNIYNRMMRKRYILLDGFHASR